MALWILSAKTWVSQYQHKWKKSGDTWLKQVNLKKLSSKQYLFG